MEDKPITPEERSQARAVFQRVKAHLLAQNRKCRTNAGDLVCSYRAPSVASKDATDGAPGTVLSCAVGCLIADASYDPTMEGIGVSGVRPDDASRTWHSISSRNSARGKALARALNESGIAASEPMHELLGELQRIHDDFEPERWAAMLDGLAADLDLDASAGQNG